MREFFKGWRRKAGLVTLAMAMLTATMWLRSELVTDIWTFTFADRVHQICLARQNIRWIGATLENRAYFPSGWESITNPLGGVSRWEKKKIEYVVLLSLLDEGSGAEFREWRLSFHWLAQPLTLLSAWLLLIRPRPAKSAKESSRA